MTFGSMRLMTLASARARRVGVAFHRGGSAADLRPQPPPRSRARRHRCRQLRHVRAPGRRRTETSRCSHAGRSSSPALAGRLVLATAAGCVPTHPLSRWRQRSGAHRTTMPPPVPVPRITPKTTSWPAPAPSVASDSAKQLASFSRRTGLASARARSSRSGRPINQVELAFLTRPVAGEIAPGMPMPTCPRPPAAVSATSTSCLTASTVAS